MPSKCRRWGATPSSPTPKRLTRRCLQSGSSAWRGCGRVHSSTATFGPQGTYKRHWDKLRHEHLDVENAHPVVHTHPCNGRRGLYVNSQFTVAIEGMDPAESRWLLEFLWDHIARVQFQCRVQWEPATLTIWDNRAVQHAAVPDWSDGHRFMHRVTVNGPPIE